MTIEQKIDATKKAIEVAAFTIESNREYVFKVHRLYRRLAILEAKSKHNRK